METSAAAATLEELRRRGHDIKAVPRNRSSVHTIAREGDRWRGVPEPRNPRGFVVVA